MENKRPDHYALLGVTPSASTKEIKRAYRKLAQKFHPDHNPDNAESAAQFRQLTQAYDILKKEHSRASYDFTRTTHDDYRPDYHRGEDVVVPVQPPSLFSQLFDGIINGDHDDRIHLITMMFLALYALVLVCGSLLQGAAFLGVIAFVITLLVVLFKDELQDFIEEPRSRPYNVAWFVVLMLVVNSAYYDRFQELFSLQFSFEYRLEGFFSGFMRFGFFMCWLAFYSEWHWLFAIWMLSIVVASFEKESIVGGWMLFGAQLLLTTLTRYYPDLMSNFVIYYQPLFTIAPLNPVL